LYLAGDFLRLIERLGSAAGIILAAAVAALLMLAFNLLRVPALIDREQQAQIATLQGEIDAALDIPILHRPTVSFGDLAADGPLRKNHHDFTSDAILTRLYRALWLGDFEDAAGVSRLTIPRKPRFHRGYWSDDPWNRRQLLRAVLLYETDTWMPVAEIENDELSYEQFRSAIPWDRLLHRAPRDFSDNFQDGYLYPLTLTRADAREWFRNLRSGRYEL